MRLSRGSPARSSFLLVALAVTAAAAVQDPAGPRFWTSRSSELELPLPDEGRAFHFAIFGDRTGGPAEGIAILEHRPSERSTCSRPTWS